MLTLGMVNDNNSRFSRIAGFVPSTQDYTNLVNDSCRELMRRGGWQATTRRMCACVYGSCITWPRSVRSVLAINNAQGAMRPVNNWYGFRQLSKADCQCCGCGGSHSSDMTAADGNTSSVFNPIATNANMWLRFYPLEPTDAGKTIRVYGIDSNGVTIRHERSDGTFQDGITLTLPNPKQIAYVQTPMQVRHVDHILKDATNGPVRGYQWDGTQLWDLAYYEPTEVAPEYKTSVLFGLSCCSTSTSSGCGTSPMMISALVKLAFIPVQYKDDLVLIDNIDALSYMAQAIKYGDAGDAQSKQEYELLAIRELNLQLWSEEDDQKISVVNNVFSSSRVVGRQQCF